MNSKPIFHIFGAPDGFDILNGTPDIIPYFRRYYNGSEENTKFSIHRDSNGNITYAYLKYNLSSYQSRTGSFFGMSLTFSNEYCTDPMNLYELFDSVYVNKVLGCSADKGLLQKIEVESKIQACYLIPNFGSAKDYIQQEIEFVLQNNITKKFANSFQPIRVTFKNDQSHLVAQIPFADANNEKIISLLHTYNRIAISPDWEPEPIEDGPTPPSPKPEIEIAPETIQLCEENVKKYQSYLIDSLANVKAANINKARQGQAEIESVLKKLQSGTSTDQRLPQLITDYKDLSGQFAKLIQKIKDSSDFPPPPPPPIPWWKRYLPYILFVFGVAVLVIFAVVLSNKKEKNDPELSNHVDTSNVSSSPEEADKSNANTIEKQTEGSNFDYNMKNEHINTQNTSNPLQKLDTGGTGGSKIATSKKTKSFCIRIQQWNIGDHPCDMDKTIPIHNDTTISTNCKVIYFCLTANDPPYAVITDSSYKIEGDFEDARLGKDWYKVLANGKNKKVAVKHKSESITITFK